MNHKANEEKCRLTLIIFCNMCHLLVVIILSNNISTSRCDLSLEVCCFLLRDLNGLCSDVQTIQIYIEQIRKRGCTEAPVKKEPEGCSTQDKVRHNQKNVLLTLCLTASTSICVTSNSICV